MPRKPRNIEEGDVVHARTRFVNEEFRIVGPRDRRKVREFLGRAVLRSDAVILAFAIMSSHIHLLLQMGKRPLEDFYRSFHTMLAIYLNGEPHRLGHVVAGRPWADIVEAESTFGSLRYVHENQLEADMAPSLRESYWTSHPCFVDADRRPAWLDVRRAALLSGFEPSDAGIAKLVAAMESMEGTPIAYEPAPRRRADLRRRAKVPLEVGTPRHRGTVVELPLVARSETPVRCVLECEPEQIVAVCARVVGIPVHSMRSRDRRRTPCEARALALHVWSSVLDQPAVEMATYLGISESAASRLRAPGSKARERAMPWLERVLEELLEEVSDEPHDCAV
ncbi:MAG: hypothetical protein JJ863_16520 [Deltaproteobacteria bacterium]|nr:hypothetical protein [Deltaproteobacteria bacterium]